MLDECIDSTKVEERKEACDQTRRRTLAFAIAIGAELNV